MATVTGTALRKWRGDLRAWRLGVLAEYTRRRQAQWELAEFWRNLRIHTCRACLREKHVDQVKTHGICQPCWGLLDRTEMSLSPREYIRLGRVREVLEP